MRCGAGRRNPQQSRVTEMILPLSYTTADNEQALTMKERILFSVFEEPPIVLCFVVASQRKRWKPYSVGILR